MIERLLSVDFNELLGLIREVMADPASNTRAAYLMLAIATLLIVIVFLVVMMIVAGQPDEEEAEEPGAPEPTVAPEEVVPRRRKLPRGVPGLIFWGSALLVVWAVTGVTTSLPYVCTACHTTRAHVVARAEDPHKGQQCVSCHEPRGFIPAVILGGPSRVVHMVSSFTSPSVDPYGQVTRSACLSCHEQAVARTTLVKSAGVRVSHAEPLAAGAECTDCHRLTAGIVGPVEAGMDACLPCHNAKIASSKCSLCHVGDISAAVNRKGRIPAPGGALIQTPDCGGCHSQKTCDACHGIRMPHTKQFMEFTHARAYAENLWYGDGKLCERCHTATRRPCTRCHSQMPSHGVSLKDVHKVADRSGSACTACHNRPFIATRNFCIDLCHQPSQGPLPKQ